jgi:protein ImuB
MLFGCIYSPDFPVQAALRLEQTTLLKTAIAVLDGPDSLQKVFFCNAQARAAGIVPGMTRIQAEALPGLVLRNRQPEQEGAAHSTLADCAYSFSPRLEATCPGTVIVDLTGTQRLFGAPMDLGRQLADRAHECGVEVNVALAANPDAALHAARGFAGITVIDIGQEALRLACLPVEVLQPEPEILETLDSWGINDFGSLASLPTTPLVQRLGQRGLRLQQLARGKTQRELIPTDAPARFEESFELEDVIELLEPLGFVLNRLLERLIARLMLRSLATDQLRIDLEMEVHEDRQLASTGNAAGWQSIHQRTLKLPVPTQDSKVLLKLLQLDLAAHPPQAPVKKVSLELVPAQIRFGQVGLFQLRAPEPAKLEVTMARLRAAVGEKDQAGRNRVGFPVVQDSHKPDNFEVLPSASEAQSKQDDSRTYGPTLALRLYRPPVQVEVEASENVPVSLVIQGTKRNVLSVSGPWRKTGAWWNRAEAWEHDEWDLEVRACHGIALYRIFRDCQSGRWFVEGKYD